MTPEAIAVLILLGTFFFLVMIRVPITFCIGVSSTFCLLYLGLPISVVCQYMVKGISSFSLMAVPFFIVMGVLMGSGGIGDKIIELADSLVGWMRGGLAQVNVVDSFFFGGISGSVAADVASLGSILIPVMVEQGYDEDFATALTITSAIEGLLIPPSHNIIIYATAAGGVSVGSLFLAGYIPGALCAIAMMITVYIISIRRGFPKGAPFSLKRFLRQAVDSAWAMMAIVIVVIGVILGVFTATESAAIAVVYSLIVSVFIYRSLSWKGVWTVLGDSIGTLSMVMILIGISNVFGYCLTYLKVPTMAATAITNLTDNPILIALLINLILLVLGMVMDMAPLILIATPILLPLAVSIGIDPVQFGMILVLNCGIGLITPPVGTVLFIGSAVGKVSVEKTFLAALPFYLCIFVILMLLTFVPQLSLFLPNLLLNNG